MQVRGKSRMLGGALFLRGPARFYEGLHLEIENVWKWKIGSIQNCIKTADQSDEKCSKSSNLMKLIQRPKRTSGRWRTVNFIRDILDTDLPYRNTRVGNIWTRGAVAGSATF